MPDQCTADATDQVVVDATMYHHARLYCPEHRDMCVDRVTRHGKGWPVTITPVGELQHER